MVGSGISAWRCSEDSAKEGLERGAWLAEGHLGHVGWSGRGGCVALHSGGGGRRWEGTLAPHGARACGEERACEAALPLCSLGRESVRGDGAAARAAAASGPWQGPHLTGPLSLAPPPSRVCTRGERGLSIPERVVRLRTRVRVQDSGRGGGSLLLVKCWRGGEVGVGDDQRGAWRRVDPRWSRQAASFTAGGTIYPASAPWGLGEDEM
jgi:hypothetical protein